MTPSEGPTAPLSPSSPLSEMKRGLRRAAPMMLGFVPFAAILGAQATSKGFSTAELSLLTGLDFAGGSEFAAIGLWSSPPRYLLLVGMILLVNSRHVLMGATLAPFFRHIKRSRVLLALAFMCDETWALVLTDSQARKAQHTRPHLSFSFYIGVASGLYITWVTSSTLGAILGPSLGDITRFGFDMAFPAVFLFLLRGLWKGLRSAVPWLVAAIGASLTYLFIPGEWYVPVGAVTGLIAASLSQPKSCCTDLEKATRCAAEIPDTYSKGLLPSFVTPSEETHETGLETKT